MQVQGRGGNDGGTEEGMGRVEETLTDDLNTIADL